MTKILSAVIITFLSLGHFSPGEVDIVIREWDVPAGAFPHDPAVGPDGSLWYTGQHNNTLGRVDPKTGEVKEYHLNTPNSGPHGLVAGTDGTIWFTANSKAYIGKLDPKTSEVTEYNMPDQRAVDPHTPVFDRNGTLWFTVQRGNFVGKLDPATGTITLKEVPTPNCRPYGIVVTSKGIPFFCEFNSNKLAGINPATMEITEYPLPQGALPRRLAIAPDDRIFYTDYARGMLGRLDPKTGGYEEWPSPGGPSSRPYGIAITRDGIVWYSESNVQPNTILRFDPMQGGQATGEKNDAFKVWPIPSGGGVVRHMVATPGGLLYLACSGVNKVAVVEIR